MRNGPYELIVPPPDYPGKRYRGRYAYEHIVNFWKANGRLPEDGCVVHHKNEHKRDNEPVNLEEKTVGKHNADHNEVEKLNLVCARCGKEFQLKPGKYRDRIKKSQSGLLYCTRSHAISAQRKSGVLFGGKRKPRLPREHGMYAMYRDGCRCQPCKTANTKRVLASRDRMKFRIPG